MFRQIGWLGSARHFLALPCLPHGRRTEGVHLLLKFSATMERSNKQGLFAAGWRCWKVRHRLKSPWNKAFSGQIQKQPSKMESCFCIKVCSLIWSECNYRISENADISTVCWQSARGIYSKISKWREQRRPTGQRAAFSYRNQAETRAIFSSFSLWLHRITFTS